MQNSFRFAPLSIICLAFITGEALAQSIAPQVLSSSGSVMQQSNGSLSFTVGELVVKGQQLSNGPGLGNGFTAAAASSTKVLSVAEPNEALMQVKVYPNPATDLVTVEIVATTLKYVQVSISDMQGRTISSERYAGISNKIGINTSTYAPGTYLLSLKDLNNQALGTYKIIKP